MNTDVRAFLVGAHFLYSHDLLIFALGRCYQEKLDAGHSHESK